MTFAEISSDVVHSENKNQAILAKNGSDGNTVSVLVQWGVL